LGVVELDTAVEFDAGGTEVAVENVLLVDESLPVGKSLAFSASLAAPAGSVLPVVVDLVESALGSTFDESVFVEFGIVANGAVVLVVGAAGSPNLVVVDDGALPVVEGDGMTAG
jgi:hypothetical protein